MLVLVLDNVSGIVDVFVDPDVVIFHDRPNQIVAGVLIMSASGIKEGEGEKEEDEELKRVGMAETGQPRPNLRGENWQAHGTK